MGYGDTRYAGQEAMIGLVSAWSSPALDPPSWCLATSCAINGNKVAPRIIGCWSGRQERCSDR